MTLILSSLALDIKRLQEWTQGAGLPLRDGDLGYAVHAALRAAFGELGPQPFAVAAAPVPRQVLGYGAADQDALRRQQALFADPLLATVFPADGILAKPMPGEAFTIGRRFGFRLRVCPVIRQDKRPEQGGRNGSRETDAFIAATQAHPGEPVSREAVYGQWLERHLAADGAARLREVRLTAFQRIAASRRHRDPQGHHQGWERRSKPDATLEGLLEIGDPAAFAALLARGIGRHRAFGFGMLLLRPPRSGPC